MHINSLPDLVLRRIFSKVPLQDILIAGRVCTLWKSYQTETCNQVRSLALLIGSSSAHSQITKSCFTLKYRDLLLNDDGTRMYSSQHFHQYFHLTYDSFSFYYAVQLLIIFPHITTLEISITFGNGQNVLNALLLLLAHWSSALKSLKMYFECKNNTPTRQNNTYYCVHFKEDNEFVKLLDTINSMQSLKHLTLDTSFAILSLLKKLGRANSIDFSILGQLNEFYFKSSDEFIFIEKSLNCFAVPNGDLKQIGLQFENYQGVFYRWSPQLSSRIVYFPSIHYFSKASFQNTLHHFSSLTYLHYSLNYDNLFSGALNFFASLPQLTHLHYEIKYERIVKISRTQASRDQLAQLFSIQVLIITVRLMSTFEFDSIHWAHLFPNVQVMEFIIPPHCFGASLLFHKQELQETLAPLVQCPKLHRLYTREKKESRWQEEPPMFEWIVLHEADRKVIVNIEK